MTHFSMKKSMPITLIYARDNHYDPRFCDLQFSLMTLAESTDDLEAAQEEQNTSYQKISMFIETMVDNSLVIDQSVDMDAIDVLNNLIVIPAPAENILLAALHSKLNSITGGNTYINEVTIVDKISNITYTYDSGHDDPVYSELPLKDDWLKEFSYWDTCWWDRYDTATYDHSADSKESYDKWCELNAEEGILELYKMPLTELDKLYASTEEHKGELIDVDFKKNVWNPRLV